jgi:class 3 adenylate cyclase/tetratricopeptide (TPR) repeat protein
MNCPTCGHENPNGAKFCNQCAGPLQLHCSNCGTLNPFGSKFCNECAAPLTPARTSDPTPPHRSEINLSSEHIDSSTATEGERKNVTALFADIKGSMELMEDLDPEEARTIVDPALKLMIDAVHRYGGYIVQSTGDGIFALFGAPIAHEDHPQRALFAALRLQEQLGRYSSQLRGQGRLPLQARVGINTGDVVVRSIETSEGHAEYTPIGHSTSLAARIQTLAPVGSTATTDTTRKLCEGFFAFKAFGPTIVKGVSEPIEVFEVTGLGPLRTRFQRAEIRGLSKFVGRQSEMDALKHGAEQARAGHGQIVAVMADPGVGKSRLFYEFKAISQSDWTVLEAFCVSYGKPSAYLPVFELLSAYFEISRDDDERKRRERILGKVLGLDRSLEDTLPYFYSLYGIAESDDSLAQMDPRVRGRRTREAIKRIVLRESLNQPLIIIFEDLHWIDSETQALLDLLVDAIANTSVLLLATYRPEYRHEWAGRRHYTQLRLDPLGRDSADEMLSAGLGDGEELSQLKRQIIERTQGTPFFMEEMVQALFEEGVLQRNGTVKLAKPIGVVKAPVTVQAVLASRIDRLPSAGKELLQTLSVLGREFRLTLVKRVTGRSDSELEQMLAQLELSEFIFELPAASDDLEYIFKHALTQEVAYNSILGERRRALHERVGHAIEELYAERLEDQYGDLARHYVRGSDTAKAVQYARLAAEQDVNRGSYAEASSLIEAGLSLIDRMPEGNDRLRAELALRSIESMETLVLYGASSIERERTVRRMCEIGEALGEGERSFAALSTLSGLYFTRGESARGLELATRCLDRRDEVEDQRLLVDALYNSGTLATACGEIRAAVPYLEQGLAHARKMNSRSLQFGIYHVGVVASSLAQTLQLLGRADEAFELAAEAIRYTRDSRHIFSLGAVLTVAGGQFCLDRHQPDLARMHCEEAISLCEENGLAEWAAWGRFIRGWALFELGGAAEGLAEMDAGLGIFERLGGVPRLPYLASIRSAAISRSCCADSSLTVLNDCLKCIERTGEKRDLADMLRLKGELLLRNGSTVDGESCLRAAIEVARLQEAKWWELRATLSLAPLLRDTNRCEEARTRLGEIYNWFTQGLELPDLKVAKALLDELRT